MRRVVVQASAPASSSAGETPAPQSPSDPIGVLRVLDAAANRAQEALRVVEDYVRLVLDDGHLTGVCKQLRHELAAALVAIPFDHRLAARETRCDVGTALETPSERLREDASSVLRPILPGWSNRSAVWRSLASYSTRTAPPR